MAANSNQESPLPQESLSIDADQVPARPQQTFSSQPEIDEKTNKTPNTSTILHTGLFENILDPPEDWHFNVFLRKIADGLSIEDLTNMKYLFEGEGGIGRGVLEKIQKPTDLFRILRTRGYISRDNLLYLQAILFWAGRKDLVEEAVEFSKTVGEVLHFYAPSDQPENGYKYVKYHIDGKDFKSCVRSDIENLRSRVATLLCIPPQYVFIRGIEPSSSLVVTLMIPEMYVDILTNFLNDGEDFPDLHELGVDAIEVDGETPFSIEGERKDPECDTEQQEKFVNIYEQLKQTKSCLEATEVKYLQLSQQLDQIQSKLNESEENLERSKSQVKSLKRILSLSGGESQPATLKEISSLTEFTESLHQINLKSVDRREIQRLINSTVNIVKTRVQESHRILEQRMLLDLQEMESKLVPLMYELERFKFLSGFSNVDQLLQDIVRNVRLTSSVQTHVGISLTPHGFEVMKKLSNKLRHKEKEKLRQKYQWNPDGQIEKLIEDPNMFLACIFFKEIEQKGTNVDAESFIAKCLSEVNREDLKKFMDKKPSSTTQSTRPATEARPQQEGQYGNQGQQPYVPPQGHQYQQQQQQQQQVPSQGPQFQQQQDDQKVVITRMAQQVQEMYNMLQTRQETYASKYEPWRTPSFPFNPQPFQQNQAL